MSEHPKNGIDFDAIKTRLLAQPVKESSSDYVLQTGRKAFNQIHGDHELNPSFLKRNEQTFLKSAAVLIPIIDHREPTILLTERSVNLNSHSGQVAFPGGQPEKGETPLETALRESWEEVALPAEAVSLLGYLNPYLSGTCYLITPVVAKVSPKTHFSANEEEVAKIFEVPLKIILNDKSYKKSSALLNGKERFFYSLSYQEHYIWGVTAGILRQLCLILK